MWLSVTLQIIQRQIESSIDNIYVFKNTGETSTNQQSVGNHHFLECWVEWTSALSFKGFFTSL